MGIAVSELLAMEYFKDFHVVAGRKGLNREVQGVTLLEAPDATRWSKGKELILSSGYVISQEPDCIQKAFREGSLLGCAAMMIKRERFLDKIPEDIVELFEEHDIPLISVPFSVPWMELTSQINTAVMNRTIRRFRIHGGNELQPSNQSYKVQKIRRILQAVEIEMRFPAFLYDLEEEKGFYSSTNFKTITEACGLKERDYWEPSRPYTKYTLCDYIHMSRYRLINQDDSEGPRISWIIMPISMDGVVQAYFVVMEAREFIDYYDEYAIRIAFLMLQGVYEQIMVTRNVGDIGFENFIHFALNHDEKDPKKLMYQANMQGISMNTMYIYIVFRQCNEKLSARSERKGFVEVFRKSMISRFGKIAFLDENEGVIFVEADQISSKEAAYLQKMLDDFREKMADQYAELSLEFGVCREAKALTEIKQCIEKCRKVLQMGKLMFPKLSVWDYEMLGPLAWLQIPEDEQEALLMKYKMLLEDEKNVEILRTLKIYLENNMNYSVTAEKMYVHINTIRKRIDKVSGLIDLDWDNPIDRLKTELLLQFLDL